MIEGKDKYASIADIAGYLKSLLRFALKKWFFLLFAILAGVGTGFLYYYLQKPKFVADTTFILEEKSAGGGGLAGLASQFGFNLGGMAGGGSIFSGDNILNILKSKKVLQQVLTSQIDDSTKDKTLADQYLEFSGLKKMLEEKPSLKGVSFKVSKGPISPLQDSILNIIYESIVKNNLYTERTSKQGTIIKVQVTATDALFARLMTERLVEEARKLYLDIRIGTAQENIRQLQRRSDSLLFLLNNKSYSVAASQPLDVNPGIRTAAVPAEIGNRDKAVLATLYAEVTKNLEASKLLLSQQTPVIQLLDRPEELLKDNKKSLSFLIMVFTLGAISMYILILFIVFWFLNLQKQ